MGEDRTVINSILASYDHLSDSERRIADFILQRTGVGTSLSFAQMVATRLSHVGAKAVSPATTDAASFLAQLMGPEDCVVFISNSASRAGSTSSWTTSRTRTFPTSSRPTPRRARCIASKLLRLTAFWATPAGRCPPSVRATSGARASLSRGGGSAGRAGSRRARRGCSGTRSRAARAGCTSR